MADTILTYDLVASPQAESKLRAQLTQLEQRMKFKGPFGGLSADTSKFNTELDRATQRVITLGTAFGVLSAAARTFREIVRSTVEVEKALTDINAVFKLTNENLGRFAASMFDVGRETAKSFEEVTKAATEFARQGLSVAKTQEAVRASLILSRDANIDVADSVKALTAATNSFAKEGLSYGQIVNRLAAADSAFAVSSKDLQESLIRVGSAASDAGISFNELIGLVTSAQQITARGGSVIAGALNTIFTRINRKGTLDALDALGVAVTDVQGRMLPTLTVLQNFSRAYDNMTGSVKNQAAELVGGVRQLNTLKAVLDDLSKSNSVFAQTQLAVANATDEADRRNAARNQSLSARFEQLKTTGTQIASNVGSIGFGKNVSAGLNVLGDNPITNMLKNAGDPSNESIGAEFGRTFIKGFGGAVSYGLLPILTAVLAKLSGQVFRNLTQDIKGVVGLKTETQERAAIEQQIVALYKAGGVALQEQLATMSSLTERAALLRNLQTSAVQNASVMGGGLGPLAGAVMQQGGFRRRTPGAAGGYVPMAEEAAAIAAGVGGAPSGARPVFLPSFNRGGGQQGIVANTSEFIVPGAAGGAIYNRAMIQRYGLPPGSTPVAAEGHIPNAAGGNWYSVPPSYRSVDQYGPPSSMFEAAQKQAEEMAQRHAAFAAARATNLGSSEASARDFEKARAELDKAGALALKIAQKKAREMEEIAASGASPRRRAMTSSQIDKLDDLTSRALDTVRRTQDAERLAFVEAANFARKQQQSIRDAPITMGNRSVYEIRAIPDAPYRVTNEGIVSSRGGGGGGGGPNDPTRPYGPPPPPMWWKVRQMMHARADGATERQMGLYAANQRIDGGESFGNLTSTQQALYTNQLRRQAAQQLGFDPTTAYFNRDARSQVNAMIAPQLAALRTQGQPPLLPPPPPAGPSGWQRLLAGARSPTTGLALGLGLPMIGSNINEGVGGTASGMLRGAASNGLNYAGFGASAGLVAGPLGSLVGAAGGGVFGALYGALSKVSKSFEELATELDQKNKRLAEQFAATGEVFRLDDERRNLQSQGGSPRELAMVRRQQTSAIASVEDAQLRGLLLNRANDPETQRKIAARQRELNLNEGSNDGLLRANARINGSTFNLFSDSLSDTEKKDVARDLSPSVDSLSDSQVKALKSLSKTDPIAALTTLGRMGILKPEQLDQMLKQQTAAQAGAGPLASLPLVGPLIGSLSRRSLSNTQSRATEGILETVKNLEASGVRGNATKDLGPATYSPFQIFDLINKSRMGAAYGQIDSDAASQMRAARQRLSLSHPGVTELDRIGLEGVFGSQNIMAGATAQRATTMTGGRATLQQALESAGIRDRRAVDAVQGINDLGGLQDLRSKLRSGGGDLGLDSVKAGQLLSTVQELINTMMTLDATERANLKVNEELEKGQRERYDLVRSLAGAKAADQTILSEAQANLVGAINRKDDATSITESFFAVRSASDAIRRRNGDITQDQYDARTLEGNLTVDRQKQEGNYRATLALRNTSLISGKDVEGAAYGQAQIAGMRGDSEGSFLGGFRARMAGLKQDMLDFSEVGLRVARSLEQNLGDAFGDFVIGAKKGKDAFRDFAVSVLGDASRMFASKAMQGILSSIPGFGVASGGPMGFAAGGMVPAMLTGGEYVFGPKAVRQIGADKLRSMNGFGTTHFANGGHVQGGSGVRDDVPASLPSGSFVLRKAAAQRLGPDYLNALASGQVQHRFLGGFLGLPALIGALAGGGIGYATGGKKGAIGGALLGGIAGGLYGMNSGGVQMDPSTGQRAVLSVTERAALGLGASAGLGLLAGGIGHKDTPGPISLAQVPAYRERLEREQASLFGQNTGKHAYLQVNPQGGYSLAGFGSEVATRRWNEGGTDMAMPISPMSRGGGSGGSPTINITINNSSSGGVTSTTSQSGGDGSGLPDGALERLQKMVKGWTQEELVNQSRSDGFLTQKGRYVNRF